MTEHTKGSLHVSHGVQGGWLLTNPSEEYCICTRTPWPGRAEMSIANGNRLAAAWNFAAGFPTAALESTTLAEVAAKLQQLAAPRNCGCDPCRGQCTSREALLVEADEMRDALSSLLQTLEQPK